MSAYAIQTITVQENLISIVIITTRRNHPPFAIDRFLCRSKANSIAYDSAFYICNPKIMVDEEVVVVTLRHEFHASLPSEDLWSCLGLYPQLYLYLTTLRVILYINFRKIVDYLLVGCLMNPFRMLLHKTRGGQMKYSLEQMISWSCKQPSNDLGRKIQRFPQSHRSNWNGKKFCTWDIYCLVGNFGQTNPLSRRVLNCSS